MAASLGILGVGSYLYKNKFLNELDSWEKDHIVVHQMAEPTHEIKLKSDVGYGNVPWIFYSDDGITWHPEKCTQAPGADNEWIAKVKTKGSLQYKFLKCPANMDPMNIIREGVWQKTQDGQNVNLSKEFLDAQSINQDGLKEIPSCDFPEWEK